jgi:hypothetical protein
MENAFWRLKLYDKMLVREVRIRPWLQDFDMGAEYDAAMVEAEIRAVFDTTKSSFSGFILWNPSNIYTREALQEDYPAEQSLLE